MYTYSLAGSKTKYAIIQGRLTEKGNFHIQGSGKKVNRDYGVSSTIEHDNLEFTLRDYFKQVKSELSSLAKTEAKYFPLQATFYNNGMDIHFQIASDIHFNRDYGASFSIPTHSLPSDLIGFLKLELYS